MPSVRSRVRPHDEPIASVILLDDRKFTFPSCKATDGAYPRGLDRYPPGRRGGTVKLMLARIRKRRRSSARRPHAAALTPVISAQIVKACARTARDSLAGGGSR